VACQALRHYRPSMRSLVALALVIGGAVAAFAIYTFGWHDDHRPQTGSVTTETGRHRLYTIRSGDVVRVPATATQCEASHEAGLANLFCAPVGSQGRYQVVFWSDRVDLYDLARHGEPMVPTFSVPTRLRKKPTAPASRTSRSCGTLSIGIGWYLDASPNVRCSSARHVMLTYLGQRSNRPRHARFVGYLCASRDLQDAEHIRCVRGTRFVMARSFGY